MNWPSVPSPWECRCGAVWSLAEDEEGETPTQPPVSGRQRPSVGAPGPPIDVLALQAILAESSVSELEDLARAVGEELGRRLASVVDAALPRPPPQEVAEVGPPPAPVGEAEPSVPSRATPSAEMEPRPFRVHVARCGKVWHADPQCSHLFHRGQRRKGIWTGTLTETAADLPPCRDCSAAWVGAT